MRQPDAAALIDAATALDVALDGAQAKRLLSYVALLAKWNRRINLTSVDEPVAMFSHHLLDSLAVVAPLRRYGTPRRLLDAGSGAGLPGIVIAIAMPGVAVTCIDAVAKKVTFIRQAAVEVGIERSLTALHGRVESLIDGFDIVVSRAFASLADFASLTRNCLGPDGAWLAMKGKMPDDEIRALPAGVSVFHVERLDVPALGAERCLIWMKPT